jgi:hypothetical protein
VRQEGRNGLLTCSRPNRRPVCAPRNQYYLWDQRPLPYPSSFLGLQSGR